MGGLNTQANIGTRKMQYTLNPPQFRNFENDGLTAYACNREGLNWIDGNAYHVGDILPFDVDGTSYSLAALQQLQLFWDQEWIVSTI